MDPDNNANGIEVREVKGRKETGIFIHLPEKLNRSYSHWIPPIYKDEWVFFNPARNKAAAGCESILLLAWNDGQPVGRIMGIIHHRYNREHNEKNARFFAFDCINDHTVSRALLEALAVWARQMGMNRIVGPLGYSDKDPQGFIIRGYEHMPIFATACNQPFMNDLVEAEGFTRLVDLQDFMYYIPGDTPELYHRVSQRLTQKDEFRVLEFRKRRELKPYIIPVFELINETYSHIYGFARLNKQEMKDLAARYLPVLDPAFVKIVMVGRELIGFVVAMPEIAPGIKRARGRLFPFGFIHILREMRKTRHLTLLLGAIREGYRGIGLDVLMGVRMLETCRERGMEKIESHLVLENNHKMLGELMKLGAQEHKRFRIYQKEL